MFLPLAPYGDTGWITYKQAAERGGQVRQGEKAMPVAFWKWYEKDDAQGNTNQIPFLRYYQVVNVEQFDGLNLPNLAAPDNILMPIAGAEKIVSGYPGKPQITHNSRSTPCYIPKAMTAWKCRPMKHGRTPTATMKRCSMSVGIPLEILND